MNKTAVFILLQIRRLRIEIEKLQWLHQQELSEMKHNLGMWFSDNIVVNIWSGSKKLIKVVLRQEHVLVFRITLMKGFDPLQMLTSVVYIM